MSYFFRFLCYYCCYFIFCDLKRILLLILFCFVDCLGIKIIFLILVLLLGIFIVIDNYEKIIEDVIMVMCFWVMI